jgi:uncharacterized protein YkwD
MLRDVPLYQNHGLTRVLTLVLFLTSLLMGRGAAQIKFDEAGEQQLVQLINQERTSQGLPPVEVDQHLAQAARKHTRLMAENKSLSHQVEGEATLPLRFADEDLHSDQQAENVSLSSNVTSAHKWFMLSPAHRANIMNSAYNVVGVAVLRSGDHVYVTEDFAHRLAAYSEPEADAALQRAVENYATAHGMRAPVRKPKPGLRHVACEMALNDSLQEQNAAELPGVETSAAWTTAVPGELPSSAKQLLSHPMSGYALGACFAPSVSQPGGIYWVVMVVY